MRREVSVRVREPCGRLRLSRHVRRRPRLLWDDRACLDSLEDFSDLILFQLCFQELLLLFKAGQRLPVLLRLLMHVLQEVDTFLYAFLSRVHFLKLLFD